MHHLGLIGGALLALCALPQVIKSFRQAKTAKGLSLVFLLMWLLGEILLGVYYVASLGIDIPTILNYGTNIVLVSTLLYMRLNYDRRTKTEDEGEES